MAQPRLLQSELIDTLFDVFRTFGYEGTTLNLLAQRTKLKKPSLYHRFPGGKAEMASAVVEHAIETLRQQIICPLRGERSPITKLGLMLEATIEFYDGGRKSCFLNSLSLGDMPEKLQETLRTCYQEWIDALAHVGQELGQSPEIAHKRAHQFFTSLQGALVVQRIDQNSKRFRETLTASKNSFIYD